MLNNRNAQPEEGSRSRLEPGVPEEEKADETRPAYNARLQVFLDALTQPAAFLANRDGTILYANRCLANGLGIASDQLVGRNICDLLPPEISVEQSRKYQDVLQNGQPVECESTINGKVFHVFWNPVLDQAGDVAQYAIIAYDVTQQKETEKQLHYREAIFKALIGVVERFLKTNDWHRSIDEALAELGQALQVSRVYIFENHRDAAGRLLTSQRHEWVAPGITAQMDQPYVHNLPLEEVGGGHWVSLMRQGQVVSGAVRSFPPSEQEILLAQDIQSLVAVPIFVREEWYGFIGFDDCLAEREWHQEEIDLLKSAARIFGAAVQRRQAEAWLKGYSEHLEEVVERRTVELQEAQEQLIRREKLAILGQLAGGISHDLRNPLGTIANAVYLLRTIHLDPDETTRECLDIISRQTEKALAICEQLMDFSRTQEANRQSLDLAYVVQEVLREQPPPDGVVLRIDPELQSLPPAFADLLQIIRVLSNLINNAYQAMPAGGEVTISGARAGDQVSIAISDSGIGISTAAMQRLFDPLYTTKAKGVGLGLVTAKNLLELNGGRIAVESQEGEGSTFTVWLPVFTRGADDESPLYPED